MIDSLSRFNSLRRPGLLIRAARLGVSDYRRERDLRRLVKSPSLPGPREAMVRLLEEESLLNETRTDDQGHYNVTRHVEVMIALVGEAMLIKDRTTSRARTQCCPATSA